MVYVGLWIDTSYTPYVHLVARSGTKLCLVDLSSDVPPGLTSDGNF